MLANGMGGIDWSGLPLVCEWLGITDIEGLLSRIAVMRAHKPPKDHDGTGDSLD